MDVEIFVVGRGSKPRVVPPSAVASSGDTLVFANFTAQPVVVRFDDSAQFTLLGKLPIGSGDQTAFRVEKTGHYGTFLYHVEVGPTVREALVVPGNEVEAHSSPEVIIRR